MSEQHPQKDELLQLSARPRAASRFCAWTRRRWKKAGPDAGRSRTTCPPGCVEPEAAAGVQGRPDTKAGAG